MKNEEKNLKEKKDKEKDKELSEKREGNKDKLKDKKEENVVEEKTHEPGLPVNDPNTGYIPFGG